MDITYLLICVDLVNTSGAFSESMSFSSVGSCCHVCTVGMCSVLLVSDSAFSPNSSHRQTIEYAARRSEQYPCQQMLQTSTFHCSHPLSCHFFSQRRTFPFHSFFFGAHCVVSRQKQIFIYTVGFVVYAM